MGFQGLKRRPRLWDLLCTVEQRPAQCRIPEFFALSLGQGAELLVDITGYVQAQDVHGQSSIFKGLSDSCNELGDFHCGRVIWLCLHHFNQIGEKGDGRRKRSALMQDRAIDVPPTVLHRLGFP